MRFGDLLFASKARCGPFPLLPEFGPIPLRWVVLAAGSGLLLLGGIEWPGENLQRAAVDEIVWTAGFGERM